MLSVHGDAMIQVQMAQLLGYGPENRAPKLQEMRLHAWAKQLEASSANEFLQSVREQVEAGVAQPS